MTKAQSSYRVNRWVTLARTRVNNFILVSVFLFKVHVACCVNSCSLLRISSKKYYASLCRCGRKREEKFIKYRSIFNHAHVLTSLPQLATVTSCLSSGKREEKA